jgi:erythromycin esterase-like protein
VSETTLEVREDPRIQVDMATRRQWTEDLLALGTLARSAAAGADEMRDLVERVESDSGLRETLSESSSELLRQWNELRNRTRSLAREVEGWVGPLSGDQASRRDFYQEMVETLRREAEAMAERIGGTEEGAGRTVVGVGGSPGGHGGSPRIAGASVGGEGP